GGARGQGRSHAVRLAQEGADIVVLDACRPIGTAKYPMPTPDDLRQTAKQIEALDRRVLAREVDIRDQDGLDRAVAEAIDQFGGIDIVCANAAIVSIGRSWEITDEQWLAGLDVNLTGTWRTVKAVIPSMIERDLGGSIILTASVAGTEGMQMLGSYVAAKHGVMGLMKTMANELGPYRIRVNAVQPGVINTPIVSEHPDLLRLFRPDLDRPTMEDGRDGFASLAALPVPWLEPVDVSNAVLWLASDEARYVTGITVPVDAGAINK
ncbi:MAG TPA: mycofactocin-coupled SDR family oxidoreductase, partial [Pseudonocardia sp.]